MTSPVGVKQVSTPTVLPPTVGKTVAASPDWLHEIKYDGYRPATAFGYHALRLPILEQVPT